MLFAMNIQYDLAPPSNSALTRIPPKYEKLSDQFVYWVIDVLLH